MISLKISDLPMGKSTYRRSVDAEDLQLEGIPLKEGVLVIDIERMVASIKVDFNITGYAQLVCDRSLDIFDYPIDASYAVLFRPDQQQDVEDEYLTVKKLDLNKNKIDVTNEIRETILLEIPIKKLHPRYFDEEGNPIPYQVDFGGSETITDSDARWDILKHIKNPNKN
jgi:uncharacterized metal-binding protein YceD (DUF177 family)